MKNFFGGLICAVVLGVVASCSGTAGDYSKQNPSTEVHGKIFSAIATENGIFFTVKKPDDFTNGISHIDFWESSGTGMELGQSDETQVVGLYPLVKAGKTYKFYLYVYEKQTENCLHEFLQVDAIGGLGEPIYDLSSAAVNLSCVNKVPSVEISGINTPELINGTITKSWLWYGFAATNAESVDSSERWLYYNAPSIEGLEHIELGWFRTSFEATGKKNFYVDTEIRYSLENTIYTTSYCIFKRATGFSNVAEYK